MIPALEVVELIGDQVIADLIIQNMKVHNNKFINIESWTDLANGSSEYGLRARKYRYTKFFICSGNRYVNLQYIWSNSKVTALFLVVYSYGRYYGQTPDANVKIFMCNIIVTFIDTPLEVVA